MTALTARQISTGSKAKGVDLPSPVLRRGRWRCFLCATHAAWRPGTWSDMRDHYLTTHYHQKERP